MGTDSANDNTFSMGYVGQTTSPPSLAHTLSAAVETALIHNLQLTISLHDSSS